MHVTFYRSFVRVRFINYNEFLKLSEISLPFAHLTFWDGSWNCPVFDCVFQLASRCQDLIQRAILCLSKIVRQKPVSFWNDKNEILLSAKFIFLCTFKLCNFLNQSEGNHGEWMTNWCPLAFGNRHQCSCCTVIVLFPFSLVFAVITFWLCDTEILWFLFVWLAFT